jgi:hypothetical protein
VLAFPFLLALLMLKMLVLAVLVVVLHSKVQPHKACWVGFRGGDTFSYFDPMANWLRYDTYAADLHQIETYAGCMPSYSVVCIRRISRGWGGNIVFWTKDSPAHWFTTEVAVTNATPPFPTYTFAPHYTVDSFRELCRLSLPASDVSNPRALWQQVDAVLLPRIKAMSADYRAAHPLRFYVLAPLQLCRKFLFHNGAYRISRVPFAKASRLGKAVCSAYVR